MFQKRFKINIPREVFKKNIDSISFYNDIYHTKDVKGKNKITSKN